MSRALAAVLFVYIVIQIWRYILDYINLYHQRRYGGTVPPEMVQFADAGTLKKADLYLTDKTHFEVLASLCSNVAIIVFLFLGLLDWYNSWITGIGLSFVVSGWLFFFLLYAVVEILSAPFSLYFTFHIEKKYGFNTTTPALWLGDFLKAMALSIVLISLVIFVGLWIVQWSPQLWWLWMWCFSLAFTIFMTYLSPYVIEPLFNKFMPMEEGVLKERIVGLSTMAGVHVSKVLTMDESKRSTHTNAYFTGIGRTKRIILFDTLIKSLGENEILSVLAHEIGHWKKHHLLKGMALSQGFTLLVLFVAHRVMEGDLLSSLFRIRIDTFYAKIVIVSFFVIIVSFLIGPVINGYTRRMEKEADQFSCDLTRGPGQSEAMVSVLAKLTKDNLSNLYPHPLYVFFNYSHPPVLERIRYIREYCRVKMNG